MAASISLTTYVNNVVAAATGRGVTDPLALASIRTEAIDVWRSYLNTANGQVLGNGDNGH
jgi:hypothetical protein